MSVKNEVLTHLESNRERIVSGQELAEALGVTRAAVWKAMKSLKEDGHIITSVSNKGYFLEEVSDVLSEEGIRLHLTESYHNIKIEILKEIDSTNTYGKKRALDGVPHGTVILAEEQTGGRGRFGRVFYSPKGTGIYMSVVLRPAQKIEEFVGITVAAAVAVCNVMDRYMTRECQIKWVNDVYVNDRKVCGILTEAVTDFESGIIDTVVVGIGINISTDDFPDEIRDLTGSCHPDGISRNQIAAEVACELLTMACDVNNPAIMDAYRKRSWVLGETVTWKQQEREYEGTAYAIEDDGRLSVLLDDGTKMHLNSGEISVRKKKTGEKK